MSALPNYLNTNRKRHALSQKEVGFLLGANGINQGNKVSVHENSGRELSLRTALAYQAIYGRPVSELFAGLYEEAERNVRTRAKVLAKRIHSEPGQARATLLTGLAQPLINYGDHE